MPEIYGLLHVVVKKWTSLSSIGKKKKYKEDILTFKFHSVPLHSDDLLRGVRHDISQRGKCISVRAITSQMWYGEEWKCPSYGSP